MVKIFTFLFSFIFFISCSGKKIYHADFEMYIEYLENIKVASKGRQALLPIIAKNKNIKYFIQEFPKINTTVFIYENNILKLQYIFIYSKWVENNQRKFSDSKLIKGFNHEVIKLASDVEDYIIPKLSQTSKKVFVGFEAGGGIANILAYNFITSTKVKPENFEVISFGTPTFSKGFKPNFSSINVKILKDEISYIQPSCCKNKGEEIEVLTLKSEKAAKGVIKIDAYQESIKAYLSSLGK